MSSFSFPSNEDELKATTREYQAPMTFGMAHVTSGRDGRFGPPTPNPKPVMFGMVQVTSGRDGGFGRPEPAVHKGWVPSGLFGGPGPEHVGITCDACSNPIRGIRHHCTSCPNFDLCHSCFDEKKAYGSHFPGLGNAGAIDTHLFLTIHEPAVSAANRADVSNISHLSHPNNLACTVCNDRITGFRFSCQSCPNVHLCSKCDKSGTKHDPTHPMLRVLGSTTAAPFNA